MYIYSFSLVRSNSPAAIRAVITLVTHTQSTLQGPCSFDIYSESADDSDDCCKCSHTHTQYALVYRHTTYTLHVRIYIFLHYDL